ncbi:MAG: hypothetical protein ABI882_09645 [Acidobacteriota bacterium]
MMKPKRILVPLTLILSAGLLFGCTEGGKISSPSSPSPSPTASPTVTEAMASAADDLSRALSELRSRNIRGSLELVDRSIASLKTAAIGASAASRTAIEDALKKLESTREMIARSDTKAEETLAKVEKSVSGLVDSVSSMVGEARQGAARAIGQAADRVKEAVGAPSPTPSPRKR